MGYLAPWSSAQNAAWSVNMDAITSNNAAAFGARFNGFNDALIRKVEIAYASDGTRSVSALIAAHDAEQPSNDGWSLVSLRVSDVKQFRFCEEAKSSAQVLSNGLHVCWFGGSVGLEFGDYIDAPENLEDFLGSKLFALGNVLHFSVSDYEP